MSQFSINNFTAAFDGGSKPTLFRCTVNGFGNLGDLRFFGKASSLPASTIGEIAVPYMGRTIKAPGDRSYEDWQVTILNQEQMDLRKIFEDWNRQFNDHVANVATNAGLWNAVKQYNATIEQLDRAGRPVRTYKFYALFPKEVSSVDVAFDQVDTISEFTVMFAYTYFELA